MHFGIFPDRLSIDLYAGVDAIKNGASINGRLIGATEEEVQAAIAPVGGDFRPLRWAWQQEGPRRVNDYRRLTQMPNVPEERDYFGWLPAEITRAVPESVINTIASMVCHAHRKGRKEAFTT